MSYIYHNVCVLVHIHVDGGLHIIYICIDISLTLLERHVIVSLLPSV